MRVSLKCHNQHEIKLLCLVICQFPVAFNAEVFLIPVLKCIFWFLQFFTELFGIQRKYASRSADTT